MVEALGVLLVNEHFPVFLSDVSLTVQSVAQLLFGLVVQPHVVDTLALLVRSGADCHVEVCNVFQQKQAVNWVVLSRLRLEE